MATPVPAPEDSARHLATTNRNWSRLTISLLWVYRGTVYPSVSGHMDGLHHMAAWLVLKGDVAVTADGEQVSAREGEWLFPKPVPRYQRFSKDAEILSINFRMEWPDGDPLFKKGLSLMLKSRDHPGLERIARRLERTVEKVTQTRYHDARLTEETLEFPQFIELEKQVILWGEAVYHTLTKAGLRPNLHQTGDPRIHDILQYLDAWPLNEPFRVAGLARRSGLSRSNLDRIVTKALGGSGKAYMDRRRLNRAMQLLHKRAIPIKRIAIETGFNHTSSFCAWFKKKTGRYPGEMAGRIF
ncbi:MAG TPA: AraC family transcriptional regulator [Rariglobus sp.]